MEGGEARVLALITTFKRHCASFLFSHSRLSKPFSMIYLIPPAIPSISLLPYTWQFTTSCLYHSILVLHPNGAKWKNGLCHCGKDCGCCTVLPIWQIYTGNCYEKRSILQQSDCDSFENAQQCPPLVEKKQAKNNSSLPVHKNIKPKSDFYCFVENFDNVVAKAALAPVWWLWP